MSEINLDISKELEMLQKELEEVDNLFDEVKSHFNGVIGSRGSGTLNFIQNQTSNLVSLRTNKVNIIQQIVNTKKVDVETRIKILNSQKEDKDGSQLISDMTNSMYDLIIGNKKDKSFEEIMMLDNKDTKGKKSDEDIDALLATRLMEEEEKTSKEENTDIDTEEPVKTYVVDLEKNVYCIDSDYNIIEDEDIPEMTITIVEEDDSYYAHDEDGNVYDVVEFED